MKVRRKLKNLKVTKVSYVDMGANQKTFYLTKDASIKDNESQVEMKVNLFCSGDNEQRKVYGIVYMPDTVDAHGDYTDADTLEKAAHQFMADYRNMDIQHNMEDGAGVVVESFIAPDNFNVNGEDIKKGSWVLVSIASEKAWEMIKRGELNSYSLYGTAEVEYERIKFLDLVKELFKNGKINISNMEVSMDDELKKFLEEIVKGLNGKPIQEVIKETVNESVKTLVKEISDVKTSLEGIVKSIEKMNETNAPEISKESFDSLVSKVDGIVETLASSVFMKSEAQNQEQHEEYSRSRIL